MHFDHIPDEEETKKIMLIQRLSYIAMSLQYQANDIFHKLVDEGYIEKEDLENFDEEKHGHPLSDIVSPAKKAQDIIKDVKEKYLSEEVDDTLEERLKEACILINNSEKLIENL